MRYFRVVDFVEADSRWYLGTPRLQSGVEIDPRKFTMGTPYKPPENLFIPVTKEGVALDFTLGAFEMPIVTETVGTKLTRMVGRAIERIPVTIEGVTGPYEAINILDTVDCLDKWQSKVSYWSPEDGIPEKVGEYFGVPKIVLIRRRIGREMIFRITKWELPIIIDENVMEALEGMTGVFFEEVEVVNGEGPLF